MNIDKNSLIEEYKILSNMEMETTKFRYANFTALLSISFILPGLAIKAGSLSIKILENETTISKLVFLLGFIFYLFALFHYKWFHRYSHLYRKRLKELETELGYKIYLLRRRPQYKKFKFHFVWALYLIGFVYLFVTACFVGWELVSYVTGGLIATYIALTISTYFMKEEPLEN